MVLRIQKNIVITRYTRSAKTETNCFTRYLESILVHNNIIFYGYYNLQCIGHLGMLLNILF